MNLKQFMAQNSNEFGKFERIKNPPSTHRDLHAMHILSQFMTKHGISVINCTGPSNETDTGLIVFEPSIRDVEAMATEEQVIDLVRCGVRYNHEYDALVMDI